MNAPPTPTIVTPTLSALTLQVHITVLANLDSLEMEKNALVKEIISTLIIFNGENSFSKLDVYAKYFCEANFNSMPGIIHVRMITS